jgi:hypothetical protein
MSSLVRRTLRTTAAAAGIAALGAGIAGTAFAATPEVPAAPAPDALGALPAAPDASAAQNVLGSVPAAPSSVSELPQLFTFQGPTVNTAGPTLPAVNTDPALPAAPSLPFDPSALPPLPSAPSLDGFTGTNTVHAPAIDPASAAQTNKFGVAAPKATDMDAANMMASLAEKAMTGQLAKGNSVDTNH